MYEWSWTWDIHELSRFWQQQYKQPKITSKYLTLLHYNIRSFYSNQVELVEMINMYAPAIISLNELGTSIPEKVIKQSLFSYNVYVKEGTNSHGGVVLAIDKKLKSIALDINEPNVITARIMLKAHQIVIASVYSPPTERVPLEIMKKLHNISEKIIIAGDLNAKHADWGCSQQNSKGHTVANWLESTDLNVLNACIKTSLGSNTTIDLIISSEAPEATEIQTLPYTGSDHLPILAKLWNFNVQDDKQLIPRTYWKLYSSILTALHDQLQHNQELMLNDAHKTYDWFLKLERFLIALKQRVTTWQEIKRVRPSISSSLRILIRHKHYLQNRYRHTKYEEDRLRLNSWKKLVKQEFQAHKRQSWEKFLSEAASPNPIAFWRTVKN